MCIFVLGFKKGQTMHTSVASYERQKIVDYMSTRDFVRAKELRELGISSRSIARATEEGVISREGRGLYMATDIEPETYLHLAMIGKRYPDYPICLISALSYYEVTVELPRRTWIAIGTKSWDPKTANSKIETVRFSGQYYSQERTIHKINGVSVQVFSIEKSLADAFRNPKLVDRSVAIEALMNTLSSKKSSLAKIVETAKKFRAIKQMQPVVDVITSNG